MSTAWPAHSIGALLEFQIGYELRGVRVRGARVDMSEDQRYEAARRIVATLREKGFADLLDTVKEPKTIGLTGPAKP